MAASPTSAPGLESRVNAPAFVPSAPPGLASNSASVSAKPFVPSGGSGGNAAAVNAKPFVPAGGAGAGPLAKSGSAATLASGAVHAPIFVPGGSSGTSSKPSGVDAKPFVPGGGGSLGQQAGRAGLQQGVATAGTGAGGSKPPKPSPSKGSRGGSRPQSQAGRGGTPELPEGDDLLGMSAVTPGDAKDVASQAAEMFKSLNPFPSQPAPPQHQQPGGSGGGARGRQGGGGGGSQRASPRPPPPLQGPPPPGFAPTTAAALSGGAAGPAGPPLSSSSGPSSNSATNSGPPAHHTSSTNDGSAAPSSSGRESWTGASAGGSSGGPGGGAGGGRGSASSGAAGGGRGRGRGRRPPGNNRPSAAYSTGAGRMQKAGMFISEQLRQELQQRSFLTQAQVNPEAEGDLGVPQVVQSYHTLYPLEDVTAETASQALGVSSQVVKGISSVDGQAYVLRRIDGRQVIPTAELLASAEVAVGRWEAVANHPNLVGLRDAFVSSEWDGSPSLFFAHDYHPGAFTLEQAHILPAQTSQGLMRNPASEEQLWSYLAQLTSALRCIHQGGLAARPGSLMPSKVLVSSAGRVRIGSLGVPEVLSEAAGYQDVPQLQREDLAALGNLLLLLACVGRGAAPSLDYLTAHFSREFCHVVAGLLASAEGSGFASWRSLVSALGDRLVDELDSAALYSDALMGEVQREADNGRLLRLLMKLSYICERPELGGDSQWAETGDRYLLKLFRDFLFHGVDEEGAPLLDWGLAAEALNKVDAGVLEKVLLMSRDEMSMLVVSYADVRRCINSCYDELKARASTQYPQQPGSLASGGGASSSQQQGMHRSRSRPSMQQQAQQY